MQKRHFAFIIVPVLLLLLNSCAKDEFAEALSGTYIVSGNDPNDSLAPTITNGIMVLQKKDNNSLTMVSLSTPTDITINYDETIAGNEVYYFTGIKTNGVYIYLLDIGFYKSNPDSVFVRYSYQDSIPATNSFNYILRGRKQK